MTNLPARLQILICQNLRNNLQHPNEYIRGVTLRFLCRIHEEDILEPLIPSVLACLDHRHRSAFSHCEAPHSRRAGLPSQPPQVSRVSSQDEATASKASM